MHSLEPDRIIEVTGVAGSSGVVYLPGHGALLGVSDSGQVTLFDLDGRIRRQRTFYGRTGKKRQPRDFEGVTLDRDTDYAWLIDETNRRLVRLHIDSLSLGKRVPLRTPALPLISPNKQFEGLTRMENGEFALAHEASPAALLVCTRSGHCGKPTHILDAPSVSEVIAGEGDELVLVSRQYGLRLWSVVAPYESTWRLIRRGSNVEGGALVPGFGLVLTEDRDPTRLLVFSSLKSWADVRNALLD